MQQFLKNQMSHQEDYSNREIDTMFKEIKDQLDRIEGQTTRTNGRVTRLEKVLTIVGAIGGTVLIIKFPEVIAAIKLFL
jgi:hypothetical protein